MYQGQNGGSELRGRASPNRSTDREKRATSETGEQRLHAAEGRDGIGSAGERQDPTTAGADPARRDVEPVEAELLELIGMLPGAQQQVIGEPAGGPTTEEIGAAEWTNREVE